MRTITIPFKISKVDEEQRRVWGVATSEALDSQGDVLDYEASKKAVQEWMKIGNIREMHDSGKAVGKAFEAGFDDAKKEITVGSYISRSADGENTWTKVKEGILTGYSVGGKVIADKLDKVRDHASGVERTINRVTDWAMSELSLVDNPANPTAQIVMVKSTDGKHIDYLDKQEVEAFLKAVDATLAKKFPKNSVGLAPAWWVDGFQKMHSPEELRKFRVEKMAKLAKKDYSDKERETMADKGQALPDGSFPIANKTDLANAIKAYGRAKDKAKAKAHIITRAKDLGATDMLPESWSKNMKPELTKRQMLKDFAGAACIIDTACSLTWYLESEIAEGDEETANAIKAALDSLKTAASSELDEIGEDEVEAILVPIQYAMEIVDLAKNKESEVKKAGANVVDGDARDTTAASVTEVVQGNTPKRGGSAVTKPVYDKSGKQNPVTKADESEDVEKIQTPNGETVMNPRDAQNGASGDEKPEDEEDPETGEADGEADAPTENAPVPADTKEPSNPPITDSGSGADAPTPAEGSGGGIASVANAEPAADPDEDPKKKDETVTTSASADGQPNAPTESKSVLAEMQKSVSSLEAKVKELGKADDLHKAVSELSGLVKNGLADITKRLEAVEKTPVPVKTQASYTEVTKGEENSFSEPEATDGLSQSEVVELFKRADYLAAHPSAGDPVERGEIFRKLWGVNRADYAHLLNK